MVNAPLPKRFWGRSTALLCSAPSLSSTLAADLQREHAHMLQEPRCVHCPEAKKKLMGPCQAAHHSLCNRALGCFHRSEHKMLMHTQALAPDIARHSVQDHCVTAGQVKWRLEFCHAASPIARLLLPEADGTASVFALFGKVGRSPRVYASRDRDALLKQLQTAAYKKTGLTLAGGQKLQQHMLHAIGIHA